MQTNNDFLYYLNRSSFTDKMDDDDLDNLRCVKTILVSEFEDYIIHKLIDVLSIVDKFFYFTYNWRITRCVK